MGNFDLYPSYDINLQTEMESFLLGTNVEVAKGRHLIFRKMRKDLDGGLSRCVCVSDTTDEPDKDIYCPYCLGAKYYWDEEYVQAYWHRPGSDDSLVFYFKYDDKPETSDELITVKLNDDGTLTTPIERVKLYNILKVDLLRGDRGRLAYYRILGAPVNRRYIGP